MKDFVPYQSMSIFFQIAKDLKMSKSVENSPLPSHMNSILVGVGTYDLSNQHCNLSGVKSVVYLDQ